MKPTPVISRTVWVLSLVSLCTDVASEMLYPIMPVYLRHIGFSVVLIGVLEGFAEAIAGLSKGYFGRLSDGLGRRLPFVQWGYALSALSKPMMALLPTPGWVFGARSLDRLGKGLRTGARDALLSDEATPATKGRVFGFHRSMDTLGAVLGPLAALVYLYFFPESYRTLFLLAFAPGLLSIALTFLIREKPASTQVPRPPVSFFAFADYWKRSPVAYRRLATGLLLFALFNSSDVFLLLKIKEAGLSDTTVIGVYVFYNLIYAITAYPMGILADRLGLGRVLMGGLCLFVVVYAGMALTSNLYGFVALFLLYGIYAAATEGVSKALIANTVERGDTATAIGTYSGFQSLVALGASSLTGWVWYRFGAEASLGLSAVGVVGVILYLALNLPERREDQ
ncbi:MAG: MFS transporter [Cytophagaceae bacterium]|nr:MFS transporter [Cytophagaceae bacterium]